MKKPSMIIFDYGQTLVDEGGFDGAAGTAAVLAYAVRNPKNIGVAEVQAKANEFNRILGTYDPETRHKVIAEIANCSFQRILYESLEIELSLSPDECENVFWRGATPNAKPCKGIENLLELLNERGIRTGVISNITFSGHSLEKRLSELLPGNRFEFVIASSDYVFRKPNPLLFGLAAVKAGLSPDEIWYCGDNPLCDIAGAKNAGMSGIFYTGARSGECDSCGAELIISDWRELCDVVTAF